jgi:hypothetical protein
VFQALFSFPLEARDSERRHEQVLFKIQAETVDRTSVRDQPGRQASNCGWENALINIFQ